uniref:Sacchrp_dh_C domain-containing protein n=1 Tax=Heterorhabditis bacteriophora TaxID=37862 RepID=A0A1I7XHU5_HETBA
MLFYTIKGVYVVSACGWDSIPCDLGVNFVKDKFDGDLNHVETFVQINNGPAGYSFNAGTYQTLILGISGALSDSLGKIRKSIMPEKIVKGSVRPPKRGKLWQIKEDELDGWALPFPGSDKSIVNRSQYYDCLNNGRRPLHIETYLRLSSLFWTLMLALWVSIFSILVQLPIARKILQKYPDQCSFYMFKNSGPTEEQIAGASFTYWVFGYGYKEKLPLHEQHEGHPNQKIVATCKGPDAGYLATSGCILSSALAIIKDQDNLPKSGGVFTTASAFGKTKIYEYLKSFGVTFQIEKEQSRL